MAGSLHCCLEIVYTLQEESVSAMGQGLNGTSGRGGVGGSGRKVEREYYYQCDLGPRGGRKLRQSRLSFTPTRRKEDKTD